MGKMSLHDDELDEWKTANFSHSEDGCVACECLFNEYGIAWDMEWDWGRECGVSAWSGRWEMWRTHRRNIRLLSFMEDEGKRWHIFWLCETIKLSMILEIENIPGLFPLPALVTMIYQNRRPSRAFGTLPREYVLNTNTYCVWHSLSHVCVRVCQLFCTQSTFTWKPRENQPQIINKHTNCCSIAVGIMSVVTFDRLAGA